MAAHSMMDAEVLPEVKILQPPLIEDSRGALSEVFKESALKSAGIEFQAAQQNVSVSHHPWTIRGLHFQCPPKSQAKLVRVIAGAAFDVAVDVRAGSPTYGQWVHRILRPLGTQMFIPHGFAHGFCTLEPGTMVEYLMDAEYSAEHDHGVAWDDPDIGIAWPCAERGYVLSEKDRKQPSLSSLKPVFRFTP